MQTCRFLCGAVIALSLFSCSGEKKEPAVQPEPKFSSSLTQDEITKGILTPEILWKFGRVGDAQVSPDGQNILYGVTRYNIDANKGNTDLFIIPVAGGEARQITSTDFSEFNQRWTRGGRKIGFLSNESGTVQLWEMNPDGTGRVKISEIEGGLNSFEYAPDGKHILFTKDVKLDKTPQELYPDLPKTNVHIAEDLMYRHWNSWEDYAYSHIFITSYDGNKVASAKDIMQGEAWDAPMAPYFDNAEISWSPNGKILAYTCKKLKGKEYAVSTNSDIYLYTLEDGKTVNITQGMMGYDKCPVFSPDSKSITWISQEIPGYEADKERLFIQDLATGKKTYLTEKFDQNVSNVVWNPDGKTLWFISGTKATFQFYNLDLASGQIREITKGVHDYASLKLAGEKLVGERMTMRDAMEIFSVDPATGSETQLSFTNKNIYDHIKMGRVQERWIKTTDNKDMLVWVIYPPGFDSTKRYPALLFCEGGPQSVVSQVFHFRWNYELMAANGYIVIAPNRRGLPTFGQAWNDQISGDYGGQNMKDYLSAVDAMKKEPYVDGGKIGAVGASYGGYSVFYLAGHHEGRFKAFIAHCGEFNLESSYAATEETWFPNHDLGGPYWQTPKPKSYAFSPHLSIQKWDTPILIISGENDFRIPYTESLQAFNAAQLRGIPSKLLIFPEESHWILKPQNAILWQREFFGWLDKWLK